MTHWGKSRRRAGILGEHEGEGRGGVLVDEKDVLQIGLTIWTFAGVSVILQVSVLHIKTVFCGIHSL